MGSYAHDRTWSDLMIDEIRHIVGPHLLRTTSMEMDCKQAADFFVFTGRDVKIAARVRRPGYADRYPFEFTIRSARDSGTTTELAKIVDGWGDWFFYGHSTPEDKISRWWLIDLSIFRAGLIRNRASIRMDKRSNGDGTHFVAFDIRSFPKSPPLLIGASHPLSLETEAA